MFDDDFGSAIDTGDFGSSDGSGYDSYGELPEDGTPWKKPYSDPMAKVLGIILMVTGGLGVTYRLLELLVVTTISKAAHLLERWVDLDLGIFAVAKKQTFAAVMVVLAFLVANLVDLGAGFKGLQVSKDSSAGPVCLILGIAMIVMNIVVQVLNANVVHTGVGWLSLVVFMLISILYVVSALRAAKHS